MNQETSNWAHSTRLSRQHRFFLAPQHQVQRIHLCIASTEEAKSTIQSQHATKSFGGLTVQWYHDTIIHSAHEPMIALLVYRSCRNYPWIQSSRSIQPHSARKVLIVLQYRRNCLSSCTQFLSKLFNSYSSSNYIHHNFPSQ